MKLDIKFILNRALSRKDVKISLRPGISPSKNISKAKITKLQTFYFNALINLSTSRSCPPVVLFG